MAQETGTVVFIGNEKGGVSTKTGNAWKAIEVCIKTNERVPRTIPFTVFGEDTIVKANLKMGEQVTICYYPDGHEFNGRWYPELRVTDVVQNGFSRIAQASMSFGQ